ncbi:MAG: hypothetical protein ACYDA9_06200 [Terriglobia bacterium]
MEANAAIAVLGRSAIIQAHMHPEKLIRHINRKVWWHVPPFDPSAYKKRGQFYSSSFREAELYGRPLDIPQKVNISNPLAGDESTIEKLLFGKVLSSENISVEKRLKLDAKIKKQALSKGFDSIVLMTAKDFAKYERTGQMPRSIELNILNARSE